MRRAKVYVQKIEAGTFEEIEFNKKYVFRYNEAYMGDPVSLTMPVTRVVYEFSSFPPFFDGLLPEGEMLEGLLRQKKIDRNDYFSQILAVGFELTGAVRVEELL